VPDNAELSTMDVVYDTVVTVTCNIGFKTFDDQLVKSVICLDGSIWNDTITNCQRTNEFILVEFAIKKVTTTTTITTTTITTTTTTTTTLGRENRLQFYI